jgi:hypothetical protein
LGNEWEWGRVLGREHLLGWGVVLQECTWRWARVQQGGGGNLLSLRESLVEALVWDTESHNRGVQTCVRFSVGVEVS